MTRHEFLAALHELLKPKVYLEVGVQHGTSLALAVHSDLACGIDPEPLVQATGNQVIFMMTSNYFFQHRWWTVPGSTDLAFIDGSHLFEDALQDFLNIERHMGANSVLVFDDVLPYSQAIAERVQPPGDWTGDVWKLIDILFMYRPNLMVIPVDTSPTGTLAVFGFGHEVLADDLIDELTSNYDKIVSKGLESDLVPQYVIDRRIAVQPAIVLEKIKETVCGSSSQEEPDSSEPPPSSEPGQWGMRSGGSTALTGMTPSDL